MVPLILGNPQIKVVKPTAEAAVASSVLLQSMLRTSIATLPLGDVFFGWLDLVRLNSLHKIRYPKRRIESYSIVSIIVSPNKIRLTWRCSIRGLTCSI